MKKLKKLFLSFVLIALIIPFGNIEIKADEEEATLNHDLTISELQFLEELSELDPTHNDVSGEIVSVSKMRISDSAAPIVIDESNPITPPSITPYGGIGTNYMTMYVTVTRLDDPGYDRFQLYSFFRWDLMPAMKMTDGIALAWSDNFTLLNSSMTLHYFGQSFNGYNNGKAYLSGTAPEAGVGYSFPMAHTVNKYGNFVNFGAIRATVRKHNSTGSANVVAKYVHALIGFSGPSFSYSASGPSIGVSISSTYDYREVYSSWNY